MLQTSDGEIWFRGNDCASLIGYSDPNQAIRKNVDPDWIASLREVLNRVVAPRRDPLEFNTNDLKAHWIAEAGLYALACSKQKNVIAKAFKKWVFGEVLPTIRKTGQYSVNPAGTEPATQPSDDDLWNQKRLDGIELFKLKNACVKKLLACCVGGTRWAVKYKIINGAINRAILDYECSKKAFLMDNCLPQTASIPELLAFDGQLLRSMMERRYHTHILENWEELQKMSDREMECRFNAIGKQMQEANKAGGYTVPKEKLLTVEEMKSKRKGLANARKHGLLPSADVKALGNGGPKKKQRTLMSFV